jgi:hypothetical protein
MLPSTADRVPVSTSCDVNKQIREQTAANVERYKSSSRSEIQLRLEELDHEWDIERAIEANASTILLVGLGLGAFADRRFYALPAIVGGFLLQHALQGWCPPVPIMRRLGFRTQTEIDEEKYALKALRGDFEQDGVKSVGQVLQAVRS